MIPFLLLFWAGAGGKGKMHPLRSLGKPGEPLCIARKIDPREIMALELNLSFVPIFLLSTSKVAVETNGGSSSLMKFQFFRWMGKALIN